jgi:diphosphomevalonate decarboxylase
MFGSNRLSDSATALAHPNIALIKYWGDRDASLHLPANDSISMNLDGLATRTTASLDPSLSADQMEINGGVAAPADQARISAFLDHIRQLCDRHGHFKVISQNNFPTGVGVASSASGFAALALAATRACGLNLEETELSRLARLGSGSACRSIPAGFVEWQAGESHATSYAFSLAPPEHWALTDCIAVVSRISKSVASLQGHALAATSPLQNARLEGAPSRLETCRQAILERDFPSLARVVELDSDLMHAVMMTSSPPLLYWQPATLAVMQAVRKWRQAGLAVCYTIDAGPNVHVLCPSEQAQDVTTRLERLPGVESVLSAPPGGPAQIIEEA